MIELLVVIAIVGVLAAVALPLFGRVQENGRTVQCASHLRKIGAALFSFAGDNNGEMPQAGGAIPYVRPGARTPGEALGWTARLEPYVGLERGIYVCPGSKRTVPNNAQYSYFMGSHAAFVAAGNEQAALRMSLVSAPSKYILGGDIASDAILPQADDSDKDDYTQDPAFSASPPPFHHGKSNILFADGHVAGYAAFDANAMTTEYGLKDDGTGYNYKGD